MWGGVECNVCLTEIPGRPATAGTARLSTGTTKAVEVVMAVVTVEVVVATVVATGVVMVTMGG